VSRPAPHSDTVHGWHGFAELVEILFRPQHLKRTIAIALVVGTVLCAINQLDVLLRGDLSARFWLKVGLTYVVPFCVSNYGIAIATYRHH
jgi:hypothetical protein